MINALINLTKGRVAPPKQINFQKISKQRGGHLQSKNLCCRFWAYVKVAENS